MSKVIVIAKIVVKEDSIEFVKSEMLKLLAPTRAETGCIKYLLNQDNSDKKIFIFYEEWETRQLLQDHSNSAHLAHFMSIAKEHIESSQIHEMTCIG